MDITIPLVSIVIRKLNMIYTGNFDDEDNFDPVDNAELDMDDIITILKGKMILTCLTPSHPETINVIRHLIHQIERVTNYPEWYRTLNYLNS